MAFAHLSFVCWFGSFITVKKKKIDFEKLYVCHNTYYYVYNYKKKCLEILHWFLKATKYNFVALIEL